MGVGSLLGSFSFFTFLLSLKYSFRLFLQGQALVKAAPGLVGGWVLSHVSPPH